MKKVVLLRADGSWDLGLGHVMRCIALAQELVHRDIKPVFVVKDLDDRASAIIRTYGFDVKFLKGNGDFDYDRETLMAYVHDCCGQCIVFDLSHGQNLLHKKRQLESHICSFTEKGIPVVVFDDYDKLDITSDIQIIPYYGAEKFSYDFPLGTKGLLGLKYFIFREEFNSRTGNGRTIRPKAKHILIAIGGSDKANVTGQIVSLIREAYGAKDWDVRVAVGEMASSVHAEEIENKVRELGGQSRCLINIKNMAELMLWADVVFTGGGLIKYEAAVTGTPNIIVSQGDLEAKRADDYAGTGAAVHWGQVNRLDKKTFSDIETVMQDEAIRKKMSELGRQLVDTKAGKRIIDEIESEIFV